MNGELALGPDADGTTAGVKLGDFQPGAVAGDLSNLGVGDQALAVYAVREDGTAVSDVSLVRWTIPDTPPPVPCGPGGDPAACVDTGAVPPLVPLPPVDEAHDGFLEGVAASALRAYQQRSGSSLSPVEQWPPLSCPLRFVVLMVGLVSPENRNFVVFEHIARTVHQVSGLACQCALG